MLANPYKRHHHDLIFVIVAFFYGVYRAKTGLELPGIVDEVLTLAEIKDEAGRPFRGFVCQTLNPWGYPAKDRSGRLDLIEEPHLGRLFEKIRSSARAPIERLVFDRSADPALPSPDAQS